MKKFKIGLVGLGARGSLLLHDIILHMDRIEVAGVCDLYSDRAETEAEYVLEKTGKKPIATTQYTDLINNPEIDTIVITSAWESHVDIAIAAMKAKKNVGMEVGGAYSVEDCWKLVDTYEETKTPFMFMENCCFGRREMMALNMAQLGVLGTIVHCTGAYGHDLRKEVAYGKENRHYRLRNYLTRNCDNYPTHDLGPIAKVLNINHGNRLLSLTSVASKASGLHDYIVQNKPEDTQLVNAQFTQGDIVNTLITTTNGETILLTLDTTLPRYYSRNFCVRGTRGMYEEVTDSVFLDNADDIAHDFDWMKTQCGNADKYTEEYDHPVWKEYIKSGVYGSHDGMDWLQFKLFFDALENNTPTPVDVYDAATWMSITALSEYSVAHGGEPVAIPDFTRGKWLLDDVKADK